MTPQQPHLMGCDDRFNDLLRIALGAGCRIGASRKDERDAPPKSIRVIHIAGSLMLALLAEGTRSFRGDLIVSSELSRSR